MDWNWTPGQQCGPFRFEEPLPSSMSGALTLLEPSCEGADWETYRVGNEEARVYVKDGVVKSLECWESLRYLGRHELIDLSLEAAEAILGEVLTRADQWEDGAMYEADDLGLTLWIEEGLIESATVNAIEEDP